MGASGGPSSLDQMAQKIKAKREAADQVTLEQATKARDKAGVKKDAATVLFGGRQGTSLASNPANSAAAASPVLGKTYLGS